MIYEESHFFLANGFQEEVISFVREQLRESPSHIIKSHETKKNGTRVTHFSHDSGGRYRIEAVEFSKSPPTTRVEVYREGDSPKYEKDIISFIQSSKKISIVRNENT